MTRASRRRDGEGIAAGASLAALAIAAFATTSTAYYAAFRAGGDFDRNAATTLVVSTRDAFGFWPILLAGSLATFFSVRAFVRGEVRRATSRALGVVLSGLFLAAFLGAFGEGDGGGEVGRIVGQRVGALLGFGAGGALLGAGTLLSLGLATHGFVATALRPAPGRAKSSLLARSRPVPSGPTISVRGSLSGVTSVETEGLYEDRDPGGAAEYVGGAPAPLDDAWPATPLEPRSTGTALAVEEPEEVASEDEFVVLLNEPTGEASEGETTAAEAPPRDAGEIRPAKAAARKARESGRSPRGSTKETPAEEAAPASVVREPAKRAEDPPSEADLLDAAARAALDEGRASVSFLQKRLGVPIGVASRLLDGLEKAGLVGPYQGVPHRDVLLSPREWEERARSKR